MLYLAPKSRLGFELYKDLKRFLVFFGLLASSSSLPTFNYLIQVVSVVLLMSRTLHIVVMPCFLAMGSLLMIIVNSMYCY